jgi:hypothetical protein
LNPGEGSLSRKSLRITWWFASSFGQQLNLCPKVVDANDCYPGYSVLFSPVKIETMILKKDTIEQIPVTRYMLF